MAKEQCSILIEKQVLDKIDKKAKKENRSRNYIINEILEREVKK